MTDTQIQSSSVPSPPDRPYKMSQRARQQRRLAPAKSGSGSSDPRRLFADSTVRSRVLELFATVPTLKAIADSERGKGPIGGHLRRPVTRYVVQDLIWWKMAAQFVTSGDLNSPLGDRLRQWATRLEAAERALGIVADERPEPNPSAWPFLGGDP